MNAFFTLFVVIAATFAPVHAFPPHYTNEHPVAPCDNSSMEHKLEADTAMTPGTSSGVINMPQALFVEWYKKPALWPLWDRAYKKVGNQHGFKLCDNLVSDETDLPWPIPFPKDAPVIKNEVVFLEERPGMYQISFKAEYMPYAFSRVDGMFQAVPGNQTLIWTREKAMGTVISGYPGHWTWDFSWMGGKFLRGARCLASVYQKGFTLTEKTILKYCGPDAQPDTYEIYM